MGSLCSCGGSNRTAPRQRATQQPGGQGQVEPLFVFQIGSTLTTASASAIVPINGADAIDVYFQVGSSATLGTGTLFAGTLLAFASGTVTTGASVEGRVIALHEAVTLDTNDISTVPEPGSVVLGISALLTLLALKRSMALTLALSLL